MSWFAGGRARKVGIKWQYTTGGILWRLMPSTSGFLILEDRDIERKSVSFACLEQVSGLTVWRDARFHETWWLTMDSVHGNTLFLHEYAAPDMPEQKKIHAVDLRSGELRWSNDEMKLLLVQDNRVYASRDNFTDRQLFELDIESGECVGEMDEESFARVREIARDHSVTGLRFPTVCTEHTPQNVSHMIGKCTADANNLSLTEYLVEGNTLVIGYYDTETTRVEQSLRQHVVMCEVPTGKILLRDLLAEHVQRATPETFFALGTLVYYIKNNKILTAIDLSSN